MRVGVKRFVEYECNNKRSRWDENDDEDLYEEIHDMYGMIPPEEEEDDETPRAHCKYFENECLAYMNDQHTPSVVSVRVFRSLIKSLSSFVFTGRLPDGMEQHFESICNSMFSIESVQVDAAGREFILFDDDADLLIFLSGFAHLAYSCA